MKKCIFMCVLLGILFTAALKPGASTEPITVKKLELKGAEKTPAAGKVMEGVKPDLDFGKVPLYFVRNQGQVHERAKFYAKASRYTLWMTKQGLVFDSSRKIDEGEDRGKGREHVHMPTMQTPKFERDVSRLMFVGANENPELVALEPSELKVNYFIGNDPSKWRDDVPTSKSLLYKSLYKHIDLKVYGIEKQVEYDWIVKPGGNPEDIRMEYKNVKGTRIDEEGNLVIETRFGEMRHKAPYSYQENGTGRTGVRSGFKKLGENTYGFRLGKYDRGRPLVIDPVVLLYSTYLGGSDKDDAFGIAVDAQGYVYVTGESKSSDFPLVNISQFHTMSNIFVSKLAPSYGGASSLLYATFLGGNSVETGRGIAVDDAGNIYVTGETYARDFPTVNQYQMYQGNQDAFFVKLDPSKSGRAGFLYSTYLGGYGYEFGFAIAVDADGNAYVAGDTGSSDFPLLNQYQTFQGKHDAFVVKLNPAKAGSASLIYATCLGGDSYDQAWAIAVDAAGNAYVTGNTYSSTFPTKNAYQETFQGIADIFVAKLDPSRSGSSSLLYSTYLGGSGGDSGYGIAVDAGGNAYVTGATRSSDFPTLNAYQELQGEYDAVIAKLDPSRSGASSLLYSTCLGGEGSDTGYGIALDADANVYVTGYTRDGAFPTLNAFQGDRGLGDAFVSKLDLSKSGDSQLIYSTCIGGSNVDFGRGIAVSPYGEAYVCGFTESANFPTKYPYQTHQGESDAFVAKLSSFPPLSLTLTSPNGGERLAAGEKKTITWTSTGGPMAGPAALSHVKLQYSTNHGLTYSTITSPTPNQGSYSWTVPQVSSNLCVVRISDTGSTGISDTSDTAFTIFSGGAGAISVNRDQLNFVAIASGAYTGAQSFDITADNGSLFWTVSDNASWMSVSPASGSGSWPVSVTVEPGGLGTGTYTGTVTVSSPGATNSPKTVGVTLTVKGAAQDAAPFGELGLPATGSTVSSSVPVSGWVVDDVGVSSVNIVLGTGVDDFVIGGALLVEGARTDIEAIYPNYPSAYKAGWGYMLLTHFLPSGDGDYTISAVATDVSGNRTVLGTTRITVDNANADKPFGAIDTPVAGGIATGSGYLNTGWVLTPPPGAVSTDGATIGVYVDYQFQGNPTYNVYRSDIAGLFPGYVNSDGAGANINLDTTAFSNGVYVLYWTATDDRGNADGIGSRFFTIRNSGSTRVQVQSPYRPAFDALLRSGVVQPVGAGGTGQVMVVKGFNPLAAPRGVFPAVDGMFEAGVEQLDRLEIRLGSVAENPGTRYAGYMVVGGALRPLPMGASLDVEKGIFHWLPMPGFIGEYPLVFFRTGASGATTLQKVRVVVKPKTWN